jgi:hypothetical protein
MWFTPFEFLFESEIQGVAFLSEHFIRPLGYVVFVEVDYSVELFLDLGLSESCVLIWLLVAGVGSVVVSVISVKMPDKDVCEVPWSLVGGFEPIDVIMSDKSAVQGEKVVKLLAHPVDVSALDHLFEVLYDGDCHG